MFDKSCKIKCDMGHENLNFDHSALLKFLLKTHQKTTAKCHKIEKNSLALDSTRFANHVTQTMCDIKIVNVRIFHYVKSDLLVNNQNRDLSYAFDMHIM